ncbi:PRTRC system ThiF family protein [Tellurirhabdus bombi]|uniref:PRTRC system ThiF family protein n=1 Tax=Tellurirhabdus bombi TaxID=2907205 RepID=UPI001F231C8E|nr:PRTRC system ThiF family protein [Tellurirhabdus bombi]
MTSVHFTANYLINPTNPVTVNLIGAGGTGSQVLTALARMNHAFMQLNHPGLHVTVWDNDEVTEANLGRQLFASAELGLPKSVALINRTNRFFGTNWKAKPHLFAKDNLDRLKTNGAANLIITCVDTVQARFEVSSILQGLKEGGLHRDKPYYWLDFGNGKDSGQVILSTVGAIAQPESKTYLPVGQLPFVTDEFGDILKQSGQEGNTPSCSLAEALTKQELFINSTLANLGSALLWNLFRSGMTANRGFFLNLADFRTMPLKVGSN